jgi:hypothetical protein
MLNGVAVTTAVSVLSVDEPVAQAPRRRGADRCQLKAYTKPFIIGQLPREPHSNSRHEKLIEFRLRGRANCEPSGRRPRAIHTIRSKYFHSNLLDLSIPLPAETMGAIDRAGDQPRSPMT